MREDQGEMGAAGRDTWGEGPQPTPPKPSPDPLSPEMGLEAPGETEHSSGSVWLQLLEPGKF